ncbi:MULTISPECIES: hypothetical protein [unclassified Duganella]|uniref:hypothetical protein n=1 Tax=unclassified Duganella TaxID=2636909 RepID=UPI00088872C8|nr:MULTISPECIES: hypothetical protein [unclassified Duganella]SDH05679.1 hypothetical protein SAMN05216320_109134 [Duganella sp. OV458]SDK20457.1 hypothetical protein SAMN05428973_109148 [Duganella sp. OV510]
MFDVSIRSNLREMQRGLDTFARKQLPFASARALTAIGRRVQEGEQGGMRSLFDKPTPFTVKSVGVKAARKNDLVATVYVRDIAASYLEPYEFGGNHKLIGAGRTWLNPKNGMQLNQYGNLSRSKLSQLRGRPDVFIGKVKTKGGQVIDGVWQRPHIRDNQKLRGMSRRHGLVDAKSNTSGRLKLLIRFGDPIAVTQKLNYRSRAKTIIAANVEREFWQALEDAMRNGR